MEWTGPAECPECGKNKFFIAFEPKIFRCFAHGEHLKGVGEKPLLDLFKSLGINSIRKIEQYMKNSSRPTHSKSKTPYKIESRLTLYEANKKFPTSPTIQESIRYCQKKWVSPYDWDKIFIGFDNDSEPRMFIPIYERNGSQLVEYQGFQARRIFHEIDGVAKIITPGVNKTCIIYNYEKVIKQTEIVVIFESIFDIPIIPELSVAILGTNLTDEHIKKILPFKTIVICFDGDAFDKEKKHGERIHHFDFTVQKQNIWYLNIPTDKKIDQIKYDFINQTITNLNGEVRFVKQIITEDQIHRNAGGNYEWEGKN